MESFKLLFVREIHCKCSTQWHLRSTELRTNMRHMIPKIRASRKASSFSSGRFEPPFKSTIETTAGGPRNLSARSEIASYSSAARVERSQSLGENRPSNGEHP